MAKKIDLSKLSMDELKQLSKDVEKAKKGFAERRRAEARKALDAVAKDHGMSVDEILGASGKKRKVKPAIKYVNPDNPLQTWSGRGRQPGWYKTAVASGKKPESMEI
ncbi:MAG: H-NS histone family protein [Silicimonas sp.]|nr:H-NS histone family protein [Silicimonas sp.]NND43639.1 H-NS histone family protein [Silicimonas sp.]NNL74583.1 H-NS histone family protein [Silicimonas sp.]